MARAKSLFFALIITFFPVRPVNETVPPQTSNYQTVAFTTTPTAPVEILPPALLSYAETITRSGMTLEKQGILIETLYSKRVIASYNADRPFNPASVIKIATSLAALETFGPDYRMRTTAFADGTINQATRTLTGNLIIDADGDPMFYLTNAQMLAQNVVKAGVSQVTGDLLIKGPLSINRSASPETSAARMLASLRSAGVKIAGTVRLETGRGGPTELVVHESGTTLRQVLLYMNAHSDNPIAERLGDAVGGPQALQDFLIRNVGVSPDEIYLSRTSGLDYNRLSARGMILVLRRLMQVLEANHMKPEDLMPVAGVDAGTLSRRFRNEQWHGVVVGKTGSLPGTDGGVSALSGIAYTREHGPVLYTIFNSEGDVHQYRRWQDELLESIVLECGGPQVAARLENALDQEIRLAPLVHIAPLRQAQPQPVSTP